MGTSEYTKKHRVAIVGSGNWGSAVAKIMAENAQEHRDLFEEEIKMWVFEEDVKIPEDSKYREQFGDKPVKLTHVINTVHENVKYLPGITLPKNITATASVEETVKEATILAFNLPHQFVEKTCDQIKGHSLPYARGISCIKGVSVGDNRIRLYSELITEKLGIYCGVLSGANIATEVAAEKWCETTIGYNPPPMDFKHSDDCSENYVRVNVQRQTHTGPTKVQLTPLPQGYRPVDGELLTLLFERPYFNVSVVSDAAGVALAGALKNVVALGAGFVAGRSWGPNAEAAVLRLGLLEMIKFGQTFFPESVCPETMTEQSAGVADLIASCKGARNYSCAKLAIERGASLEEIEQEELNGQKLQGPATTIAVCDFLAQQKKLDQFPLFRAIHEIIKGERKVDDLPNLVQEKRRPMQS